MNIKHFEFIFNATKIGQQSNLDYEIICSYCVRAMGLLSLMKGDNYNNFPEVNK